MNRLQTILIAAALGCAALACGENAGDGGNGAGGSGATGGSGGSGGVGGSGGTGGTAGEASACDTDDDCNSAEVCVRIRGLATCALLCESEDDCHVEGDSCLQAGNGVTVCHSGPNDDCVVDADCARGDECIEGSCFAAFTCMHDSDCESHESCMGGSCVVPGGSCETTAECYDQGAYCADFGTSTACISVACGGDLNSCSRCALGPSGGAADASGPLIFFPAQEGACVQEPDRCLPGTEPWLCTFSFLAFDPDGDLPAADLGARVRLVDRDGDLLPTFDTSVSPAGGFGKYRFSACFPETTSGSIGGAVVLDDDAGNESQTLCFDGNL